MVSQELDRLLTVAGAVARCVARIGSADDPETGEPANNQPPDVLLLDQPSPVLDRVRVASQPAD